MVQHYPARTWNLSAQMRGERSELLTRQDSKIHPMAYVNFRRNSFLSTLPNELRGSELTISTLSGIFCGVMP
jgi:hypothetical protein